MASAHVFSAAVPLLQLRTAVLGALVMMPVRRQPGEGPLSEQQQQPVRILKDKDVQAIERLLAIGDIKAAAKIVAGVTDCGMTKAMAYVSKLLRARDDGRPESLGEQARREGN
jgi:hypothetical protein